MLCNAMISSAACVADHLQQRRDYNYISIISYRGQKAEKHLWRIYKPCVLTAIWEKAIYRRNVFYAFFLYFGELLRVLSHEKASFVCRQKTLFECCLPFPAGNRSGQMTRACGHMASIASLQLKVTQHHVCTSRYIISRLRRRCHFYSPG